MQDALGKQIGGNCPQRGGMHNVVHTDGQANMSLLVQLCLWMNIHELLSLKNCDISNSLRNVTSFVTFDKLRFKEEWWIFSRLFKVNDAGPTYMHCIETLSSFRKRNCMRRTVEYFLIRLSCKITSYVVKCLPFPSESKVPSLMPLLLI